MLDPQYRSRNSVSPQYEFGFKLARGRGRPKKLQIIDRFFLCIWRGMRDVASGWEPRLLFWQYLFAALDPDYRDMVEEALHEPFPWRARIQPVERDKGRRSDPELPMRDKVLAWLVQRGLDRGEKYNSAIAATLVDIENERRVERWRGWITRPTLRNAYDRHTRSKSSK